MAWAVKYGILDPPPVLFIEGPVLPEIQQALVKDGYREEDWQRGVQEHIYEEVKKTTPML